MVYIVQMIESSLKFTKYFTGPYCPTSVFGFTICGGFVEISNYSLATDELAEWLVHK